MRSGQGVAIKEEVGARRRYRRRIAEWEIILRKGAGTGRRKSEQEKKISKEGLDGE